MQIFEYWVLRCVGVCLQQEGISLDQMLHFPLCKAKKSSRRLWESQIKGFVTPVMPGNSARILAALFFMFFWALVNSLFQAERAGFPVSAGVQTNKNGPRSPGSGLGYKGYTFSNFFFSAVMKWRLQVCVLTLVLLLFLYTHRTGEEQSACDNGCLPRGLLKTSKDIQRYPPTPV